MAILVFAETVYAFTMSEKIVVGDDVIMVARCCAGGLSTHQRIDCINDRLSRIISYENLSPENIRVSRLGGEVVIMVGKELFLTVTPADARANNTDVISLANRWKRNAQAVLYKARPSPTRRLP
ncbi:MAG: hypothetical protein ABFD46_01195 [Armatimonadota bacterium]